MKLKIVLGVALLSLIGCNKKDVLPEDKLKNILFRFAQCEAVADIKNLERDSVFLKACYADVLSKEGVTTETFEKTMTYYKKRPIQLEAIYDSVLTTASTYKLP